MLPNTPPTRHMTPGARPIAVAMDLVRPAGIFRTPPASSAVDPLRWLWSAGPPALGPALVALAAALLVLFLVGAAM